MRLAKKTQLHFGEVTIADIDLSARSRDDKCENRRNFS